MKDLDQATDQDENQDQEPAPVWENIAYYLKSGSGSLAPEDRSVPKIARPGEKPIPPSRKLEPLS